MQRKLTIRIILDIVLLISAVFGLWWILYPIGIFGSWHYRKFYEFPLLAILLDIMYSTSRVHLFNFQYVFTLGAVAIFLFIIILKTKVRKEIWQTSI